MKNTFKIFLAVLVTGLCSCNKQFLDRPTQNQPSTDNYYKTPGQVQGATALLYNEVWYNWLDKAFHCIGEVYGGNMITSSGDANYGFNTYVYFTVASTDGQDLNTWNAFYQVAGKAAVLMNAFQQIRTDANASYVDPAIAECRFFRGVAYFFIARVYGDAPIVTDPVSLANSSDYNLPRYLQKDVLRFALEDLKAAEAGLPEDAYQPGRVTRYSAAGMEAKLYLYEGQYDSAAIKANEVIQSSKYSLYPDYEGMFTKTEA
ncbi:MAG: RagB/SusD family nutrient uptake outer membrane protein, partial [Chitinophaga rupis]